MELVGLENTKNNLQAEFFRTPTAAIKILRKGRSFGATAANDNGAINVWYDDNGILRGDAMRHYSSFNKREFKSQKELIRWLKKMLKAIE